MIRAFHCRNMSLLSLSSTLPISFHKHTSLIKCESKFGTTINLIGLFTCKSECVSLFNPYSSLTDTCICRCIKPIKCGDQQFPLIQSRGHNPITDIRVLPAVGASSFTLDFDMYSVPDRIFLFDADTNEILYDAGFRGDPGACYENPDLPVSGPGQGQTILQTPQGLKNLGVGLDSPCEGTAWTYNVTCGWSAPFKVVKLPSGRPDMRTMWFLNNSSCTVVAGWKVLLFFGFHSVFCFFLLLFIWFLFPMVLQKSGQRYCYC